MPIDLSMIGLQGQQAHADRMQTYAAAKKLNVDAEKTALENQTTERLNALNAKASERLSKVLKGQSVGSDEDPESMSKRMTSLAQPLEAIADIYLAGGAPETGIDLLKSASTIRKQESEIDHEQYKVEQTRLENIVKGGNLVAQTIGVARNEGEFKYGIQRLRDQGVIEPEFIDQIEAIGFSPDATAYWREQAISAADKARLDMQQQTNDRLEKQGAAAAGRDERKIQMQAARDRETQRHNRMMEKASGNKASSTTAPDAQAVKSAKLALQTTVFRDIDPEDVDIEAAATYVAAQAKQIVKQNPAISWDTAVNQAVIRGQTAGAFGVDGGESTWFGFGSPTPKDAKFDGTGMSPETAAPPPVDKAGKVDRKALKKGRYYILGDGRVGRFNGTGMVVDE